MLFSFQVHTGSGRLPPEPWRRSPDFGVAYILLVAFGTLSGCHRFHELTNRFQSDPRPRLEKPQPIVEPILKSQSLDATEREVVRNVAFNRHIRDRCVSPDSELARRYVGLTMEAAGALAAKENREFRIGSEDRVPNSLFANYCPGRITAHLENDIVIAIECEGSWDEFTEAPSDVQVDSQ